MLVVLETLVGTAVHALVAVEQVGSLIPNVAQCIDVERVNEVVFPHHHSPLSRRGEANLHEAHTLAVEEFLHFAGILLIHLDDDAGILSKQVAHHVVAFEATQVDAQSARGVGETHFQKRGDESAGRNVVSGKDPAAADHFLHSVECIAEILCVEGHLLVGISIGHVVAQSAKALGKGRSAKLGFLEREVDVVDIGALVVDQDR